VITKTPAFSQSEFDARLANIRQHMRAAEIPAAVYFGPEALYYLTGYDAHTHFSQQAAIVFEDDAKETVLIVRDLDRVLAHETVAMCDVRTYHYAAESPATLVHDALREGRIMNGRVGLELKAASASPLFVSTLQALDQGRIEFVDAGDIVGDLRLVKSENELAYTREAARVANLGVKAALATIAAGVSEFEIAAAIEHAVRSAGGEYPAMPTWVCSGPRTISGHATPRARSVGNNEAVYFSFAGVSHRYHVTNYHTVFVGDPPQRFTDAYAIAIEALDALTSGALSGHRVSEPSRAAAAVLEKHGVGGSHLARWGYGVGIAYPPTWLEPFDIIVESEREFVPGMVFCLHAAVCLPEEDFGITVGGDYLLTEEGLEHLDEIGPSLHVI
jgi:Xaa-Pro dipeptidase